MPALSNAREWYTNNDHDIGDSNLQLPENKDDVRDEKDFGGNEDFYVDDYHNFWSKVF